MKAFLQGRVTDFSPDTERHVIELEMPAHVQKFVIEQTKVDDCADREDDNDRLRQALRLCVEVLEK
jgi:hypothetical protein